MTKIETASKEIGASNTKVFEFLGDFNNFQKLLPEDKIENWTADKDHCSFRIKGMADIGMKIEERSEYSSMKMVSHGKVPFPFTLNALIQDKGESLCEVQLIFEGEINAFMKIMVEKPLTNFFNMVVDNLEKNFK